MEKGAREEAYTGKKACDEADRREKWEDERRYQALGKRKEKRQMYLIERHVRRRFFSYLHQDNSTLSERFPCL